jgi:hypothetical protein
MWRRTTTVPSPQLPRAPRTLQIRFGLAGSRLQCRLVAFDAGQNATPSPCLCTAASCGVARKPQQSCGPCRIRTRPPHARANRCVHVAGVARANSAAHAAAPGARRTRRRQAHGAAAARMALDGVAAAWIGAGRPPGPSRLGRRAGPSGLRTWYRTMFVGPVSAPVRPGAYPTCRRRHPQHLPAHPPTHAGCLRRTSPPRPPPSAARRPCQAWATAVHLLLGTGAPGAGIRACGCACGRPTPPPACAPPHCAA